MLEENGREEVDQNRREREGHTTGFLYGQKRWLMAGLICLSVCAYMGTIGDSPLLDR
jgi:phage-related holin